MWHRTAAILHIKKKKRGASSNPGATLFDWFFVKLAETLKKVMGSLVLVMSSRGQNSAALMLRTHSVLYQPGFLLLRLPQHLLHLFYPLGLQPTGTTTHRGKECVMTRLRQGWKKSQQTCSLGTKHWERKKKEMETKVSSWTAVNWVQWPFSWEKSGQTWVFPWKQSQSLTFLGYRRSCRWRRWSPCCLSSPGSGCRTPGCRSVAAGGAGWSDGLWETDLCRETAVTDLQCPLLMVQSHSYTLIIIRSRAR